jgi:iron(III) transport system substrate-binding protein
MNRYKPIHTLLLAAAGLTFLTIFAGNAIAADTDAKLGGQAVSSKLDALYQKAVKSGQTTVVTYGPGENIYQPVYQVFEKRYPKIKVVPHFIFGSRLNNRLNQEFVSGKHVGSIQTGAGPVTHMTAGQDRCESYAPFTAKYLDSNNVGPDNIYHAVVGWVYGIPYNTDIIKSESDAPKGWKALADPKWKGKLVMEDITKITGTTNVLSVLVHDGILGKSWLRAIKSNQPSIAPNRSVATQYIASGRRAIDLVDSYDDVLKLEHKGMPIGYVFPTAEGAFLSIHYSCLIKGTPSPAAAKLLLNWMFTPEAQDAFAQVGAYGLRPGSTPPPGLPSLADIKDKIVQSPPVPDQAGISKELTVMAKKVFR